MLKAQRLSRMAEGEFMGYKILTISFFSLCFLNLNVQAQDIDLSSFSDDDNEEIIEESVSCEELELRGIFRVIPIDFSSKVNVHIDSLGSGKERLTISGPNVPQNSTLFNGRITPGYSVLTPQLKRKGCVLHSFNPVIGVGEYLKILEQDLEGSLRVQFARKGAKRFIWFRRVRD